MAFDTLGAITFGFMLVPFLAYAIVVRLQWGYAENAIYRQTVLSTRAAFFLPGYAFFMWISILAPKSFTALSVLINLVEGYSFYTFFSMIIYNLGGTAETVDTMEKSGKDYFLCSFCFPTGNKALFFRRNAWCMFHMLFTRVGLSILGAIAYYTGTQAGRSVAVVIQVVCAVIVVTMVFHLINLYEMVYSHCQNLFGLMKLFLLKFSVGLIVLEGLICNFLISTGNAPYDSDDGDDTYDSAEKTQRGYCALVLIELMVLAIFYLYAFGFVKVKPSTAPNYNASKEPKHTEHTTFYSFYCSVWAMLDILGTHWLNSDVKSPLNNAESSNSSV